MALSADAVLLFTVPSGTSSFRAISRWVTLQVGEGEHLLVVRGEPRERLGDVETLGEAARVLAPGEVDQWVAPGRGGAGPAPAVEVRAAVAGYPVDPGRETRLRGVEALGLAPHAGEDVLDEVLGERAVTQ